jgi:hypothetical protein
MLNSLLLIVYDKQKIDEPLDLDRPINEYFIKSTHNTYLTSHQLVGKSSTKMYSTSLLYNFRLVELDCYNGEGDNIIITHGYTFVTDLDLDDILHELKNTAFVNSDLPVILSIENHLDEHHQKIMANKLKSILVDLYIIPYDEKPQYIPTLRDMQKKFLVKSEGKKLWENEKIPRKRNYMKMSSSKVSTFSNINNSNITNISNSNISSLNNSIKNKKDHKKEYPNLKIIQKKIIFLNKISDFKMGIKHAKTSTFDKLIKMQKSLCEAKTFNSLENVRGIISVKLIKSKIDTNYYKPWEMITIGSRKATKFADNLQDKEDIVKVTQKCLIKVYPESLESDNYNMIKCFSCGIQACAINMQTTEDDFILYDKIFFKKNGGLGYVVKHKKFLSGNNFDNYKKHKYICHMEIVSLINCSLLIENAKLGIDIRTELKIKIYSIGVKEDESNPVVNAKLINGTMFPSFENGYPKIDYKVYDYELSAIMIKIFYGYKMIGRGCIPYYLMKQGFRRIPIYNNQCFSVDDTYMIGYFVLQKA